MSAAIDWGMDAPRSVVDDAKVSLSKVKQAIYRPLNELRDDVSKIEHSEKRAILLAQLDELDVILNKVESTLYRG